MAVGYPSRDGQVSGGVLPRALDPQSMRAARLARFSNQVGNGPAACEVMAPTPGSCLDTASVQGSWPNPSVSASLLEDERYARELQAMPSSPLLQFHPSEMGIGGHAALNNEMDLERLVADERLAQRLRFSASQLTTSGESWVRRGRPEVTSLGAASPTTRRRRSDPARAETDEEYARRLQALEDNVQVRSRVIPEEAGGSARALDSWGGGSSAALRPDVNVMVQELSGLVNNLRHRQAGLPGVDTLLQRTPHVDAFNAGGRLPSLRTHYDEDITDRSALHPQLPSFMDRYGHVLRAQHAGLGTFASLDGFNGADAATVEAATAIVTYQSPVTASTPSDGSQASASSSSNAEASVDTEGGRPSAAESEAENFCTVCQEDFQTGEELRLLPCFHRYHKDCVDPWLRRCACCPICKHVVRDETQLPFQQLSSL